jgi:hypothetical protein
MRVAAKTPKQKITIAINDITNAAIPSPDALFSIILFLIEFHL